MIVLRKYIGVIFVMSVCHMLSGCIKMDTLPQLEIAVVDKTGTMVAGAYVALFETVEDWSKLVNPVQVWRTTGSDGKVLFNDLNEINYFIYVRFNGMDNSLGEISTTEPLQMNQKNLMIVHLR